MLNVSAKINFYFLMACSLLFACSPKSGDRNERTQPTEDPLNLKDRLIPIRLHLAEKEPEVTAAVTTFDDVRPILVRHCISCHHEIDVEFKTSDASKIQLIIQSVTAPAGQTNPRPMPPPEEPGTTRLAENEIFVLKSWAFGGGQLGTGTPSSTSAGYPYHVTAKIKTSLRNEISVSFEPKGDQQYLFSLPTEPNEDLQEMHVEIFSAFDENLHEEDFAYSQPPDMIEQRIDTSLFKNKLFSNQLIVSLDATSYSLYLNIMTSAKLELLHEGGFVPGAAKEINFNATADQTVLFDKMGAGSYILRMTAFDERGNGLGMGDQRVELLPGSQTLNSPDLDPQSLDLNIRFLVGAGVSPVSGKKMVITANDPAFDQVIDFTFPISPLASFPGLKVGQPFSLQITLVDASEAQTVVFRPLQLIAKPDLNFKTLPLKMGP